MGACKLLFYTLCELWNHEFTWVANVIIGLRLLYFERFLKRKMASF
jgi:hypothetical protein